MEGNSVIKWHENMSKAEYEKWVEQCFDTYEKEGFSKVFCSPYDLLPNKKSYNGKRYKVIGRVTKENAELETLPMWDIEFEDGYTMAAYPEEIIPSEIKGNMWRQSDQKYITLL